MSDDCTFSKQQVHDFVKSVRGEVGNGWSWLTPRVQEALIAEKALLVLGGQHADVIYTNAILGLLYAMLIEAGLLEGDK